MKRTFHLLVTDPQNDFCDLPPDYLPPDPLSRQPLRPALPVPGAHADMLRLAALIERGGDGITAMSVTLDSHHRYHIANTVFWRDAKGGPVQPFTPITAAQVRAGTWLPRDRAALPRVLAYLDALEAAGRYTLMAWPVHCEVGTWGHNVHAAVHAACSRWEDRTCGIIDMVSKGGNPWTEHYSSLQAEVPDPEDVGTQLNRRLLGLLAQAERVFIAGEAGSHCVRATTEHLVAHVEPALLPKLVLLTDCMSPVAGFEIPYRDFLRDMGTRGVQAATAADVLPELLANARR